eukprot:31033-Pelagococcus_subviridis.AAC.3
MVAALNPPALKYPMLLSTIARTLWTLVLSSIASGRKFTRLKSSTSSHRPRVSLEYFRRIIPIPGAAEEEDDDDDAAPPLSPPSSPAAPTPPPTPDGPRIQLPVLVHEVNLGQQVDVRRLHVQHARQRQHQRSDVLGRVRAQVRVHEVHDAETQVVRIASAATSRELGDDGLERVVRVEELHLSRAVHEKVAPLADERRDALAEPVEVLREVLHAVHHRAVGTQVELSHRVVERDELLHADVRVVRRVVVRGI